MKARGMTAVLGALAAGMTAGCVSGAKVRADAEVVRADIDRARRSGAMRCAPRELAMAEAKVEFALGDLTHGNSGRAGSEIHDADAAVKKALVLSRDCGPKQVLVKEGETPTKKSVIIEVQSPTVTTKSPLSNGSVGAPYDEALAAEGGRPPYTWSLGSGALPAGLELQPTGHVQGSPSTPAQSMFDVVVTDSNGQTAKATFALDVFAGLTITTATLPDGFVGTPYNSTLNASGGHAPYAWSVTGEGALPGGISLDRATGALSGTPPTATAAPASFTAEVTDAKGKTATRTLTIRVNAGLTVATTSLPEGYVGVAYKEALQATGGKQPYAWSLGGGALPPGMLIAEGAVAGTPSAAATATFAAQVTDASGQSANKLLTVTIYDAPSIATASLPDGKEKQEYPAVTIQGQGGKAPYAFAITQGALPEGLAMSAAGALSGTPAAQGTSNLTVELKDANGKTATRAYTLEVKQGKTYKLVVLKKDRIEIKQQIRFKTGKAEIVGTDSLAVIGEVAQVLKDNPNIAKVRVEGHTDSVGSDSMNMKLSQARADSVKAALVRQGVDPDRLDSVGFGPTKPIESNKTRAGRAANRRTEFNIVEQ